MKFLIDMNLSPLWADWFRAQGHEGVHWSQLGASDASDSTIMELARQQGWTILTSDLDFGTLLAFSQSRKPSVILLRADDLMPEAAGPSLLELLERCSSELEAGALAVLDPEKARIRLLPLLSAQAN